MTEKEKMMAQKLYDANYDKELEKDWLECKSLCQEYNHLPVREIGQRKNLIKKIIGKTGEQIHIEPDFIRPVIPLILKEEIRGWNMPNLLKWAAMYGSAQEFRSCRA